MGDLNSKGRFQNNSGNLKITAAISIILYGLFMSFTWAASIAQTKFPAKDPDENTPIANAFLDLLLKQPLGEKVYSWTSGSPPTVMDSTANWHCFLTRISGRFRGGGEGVWIEKNSLSKDTKWQLNGIGVGGPVTAEAICVSKISFATRSSKKLHLSTQSRLPDLFAGSCGKLMLPLPMYRGMTAFIGKFSGNWRGGGENISVTVTPPKNDYPISEESYFSAKSCAGYSGGALYNYYLNPGNVWNPNYNVKYWTPTKRNIYMSEARVSLQMQQLSPWGSDPLSGDPFMLGPKTAFLAPVNSAVCGLVDVAGRFDGFGEFVEIRQGKNSSGEPYWILTIDTRASGGYVQAAAACVARDQR